MMQPASFAPPTHESPLPIVAFDRFCDELRTQAHAQGTPILLVGHRAIARTIGCSAARIPEFMQRLEDRGDIIREPFKNRYLIDVSPLIDQGMPDSPTLIDHPDRSGLANRARAQQDAPNADTTLNRVKSGRMVSHVTTTDSQESVVVKTSRARAGLAADHPIALLLAELGKTPGRGVLEKVTPHAWTPQQIHDRYEYDEARKRFDPAKTDGIFWNALMAGERAPARPDPTAPLNPADYATDPAFRLGSDTSGLAPPSDDAPDAALEDSPAESYGDRAQRLLPNDASTADWVFVQTRLARGDSDAGALAALANRRARGAS